MRVSAALVCVCVVCSPRMLTRKRRGRGAKLKDHGENAQPRSLPRTSHDRCARTRLYTTNQWSPQLTTLQHDERRWSVVGKEPRLLAGDPKKSAKTQTEDQEKSNGKSNTYSRCVLLYSFSLFSEPDMRNWNIS